MLIRVFSTDPKGQKNWSTVDDDAENFVIQISSMRNWR